MLFVFINMSIIDMLILYSYHKQGYRISREAAQRMTRALRSSLYEEEDKNDAQVDTDERLAAIRRFVVYKELADAQIRQILGTMLSLKKVEQTILESTMSEHIVYSESEAGEVSNEVPSDSLFQDSLNSDE